MTSSVDLVTRWTREIANLRAQAAKLRRTTAPPACTEAVEHALAVCDSVLQDLAGAGLECEGLRAELRTETAAWERLFDTMPVGCLITDGVGSILNANRAAGVFLNVSVKNLKDRQLLMFSIDRDAFRTLVQGLRPGTTQHRATLLLRPKERKARETDILVVPLSEDHPGRWLWFLDPSRSSSSAQVAEQVVASYGT
jgi:PAS domain-containing protein